ncbi:MAG: hypothetical protein ACXVHB_05920 [Solirubrobacteraceae bacterium]
MALLRPSLNAAAFKRVALTKGQSGAGIIQAVPRQIQPNGQPIPGHVAAAATQQTPPGPRPGAPTVQPFLTPVQQSALTAWNTKYAGALADLGQSDTDVWAKFDSSMATDQLKYAQNADMTNQSMAARGMFQSSIRDNALNDLGSTLAQQQNILKTNRDSALFHNQTQRGVLAGQDAAEQANYQGLEVTNAQGVPPDTNAPAAPAAPAQQPAVQTHATVANRPIVNIPAGSQSLGIAGGATPHTAAPSLPGGSLAKGFTSPSGPQAVKPPGLAMKNAAGIRIRNGVITG